MGCVSAIPARRSAVAADDAAAGDRGGRRPGWRRRIGRGRGTGAAPGPGRVADAGARVARLAQAAQGPGLEPRAGARAEAAGGSTRRRTAACEGHDRGGEGRPACRRGARLLLGRTARGGSGHPLDPELLRRRRALRRRPGAARARHPAHQHAARGGTGDGRARHGDDARLRTRAAVLHPRAHGRTLDARTAAAEPDADPRGQDRAGGGPRRHRRRGRQARPRMPSA